MISLLCHGVDEPVSTVINISVGHPDCVCRWGQRKKSRQQQAVRALLCNQAGLSSEEPIQPEKGKERETDLQRGSDQKEAGFWSHTSTTEDSFSLRFGV
ncbi:G2/Mitotic-Specific Cyclin-B3 [Manis pentadactyla]|nr:G2/Mitotic-Specific Cyclin-B3 [Manis pentadactyla]